ncbi:MAG TPA: sulfurtransferase [Candidatus Acidoferrales bacterium]|nr:sulfurtransferase [Candidatus Acidoferrales bacterium]
MPALDYNPQALLTTPAELKNKIERDDLCVIDTRTAEEFCQGHIPGAVHFDLFGISIIDTRPQPLRAFMWMMLHLFELRGVNAEKEVVVYEQTSGMRAARAFWFLEYFGHPRVSLLDGGIQAWRKAGYELTTAASPPKAAHFNASEKRAILATVDDVQRSLARPDVQILDTRSEAEYLGRNVRAARGGAIPGALHLEWTQNLDAEGKFKPPAELETMYRALGLTPEKEVISYCQGGYRSSHSYIALRLIGYPKVRNYIGSWKEWGDRLDLPIDKPWERGGG